MSHVESPMNKQSTHSLIENKAHKQSRLNFDHLFAHQFIMNWVMAIPLHWNQGQVQKRKRIKRGKKEGMGGNGAGWLIQKSPRCHITFSYWKPVSDSGEKAAAARWLDGGVWINARWEGRLSAGPRGSVRIWAESAVGSLGHQLNGRRLQSAARWRWSNFVPGLGASRQSGGPAWR